MTELVIGDLQVLQCALANELESLMRAAVARHGRFTIAIPGGSVATAFYPALAGRAIDWSSTDFFWIDERAVPPSDAESNYALASSLWLGPAGVPASRIHRLRGEDRDLERAARDASHDLAGAAGDPPRLDAVLAGVGEDGHVASLFPGRSSIAGESGIFMPVADSPKPPARRITLTLPVLTNADRVIVAALGRAKAEAVCAALEQRDASTPLAVLLRRSRSSLMLLDHDAARLVSV